MAHIFLSIGSNLGDRQQLIKSAGELLPLTITKSSSLYETEPWGGAQGGWFLNQVIEGKTPLTSKQFLKEITRIEKELGRKRIIQGRYEPRTIDIDILFWDDEIILPPPLHIPHPLIGERRFVLEPLVEIAPDFTHPVLKKTMKELLNECPDHSIVRTIS